MVCMCNPLILKGFLIGFLTCYIIAGLLIFLEDNFDFSGLTIMFVKPWCALGLTICFIPAIFWYAFKNVIHPVKYNNWEKYKKACPKSKKHHVFGSIYIIHDTKAKAFYHKIFFVRIKDE